MNENYLKEKAQGYALGQYLSEVPEDMTYEQVLALLNGIEDLPDDLQIWEPFEFEDRLTVAEHIETTKENILELLQDVTKKTFI